MRYIDKHSPDNKALGDSIVNEFIATQNDLGNDFNYFIFGKTPYKNELRDVLIEEQEYYCCYCMRQLEKDATTTIEHVIPKSSSVAEVNEYKERFPACFDEVIHLSVFNRNNPTPPFPHSVAYQNLAASCKGILEENSETPHCCNNKRHTSAIVPIMFDENIQASVQYFELSGTMRSKNSNDQIDNTILVLGLNAETLKEIRFLWALAAKKNANPLEMQSKRAFLEEVLGINLLSEAPANLRKYFINEYYWDLFKSYHWFESYFKAIQVA